MEYSIGVSADRNYIILKVVGEFTVKTFMQCIVESHALGKELGLNRYLVDAREARNMDTAFANYRFAYHDMQTTPGVDPLARVAGLVSPGDHSHDFVETVSNNAGMFLKLFTELAAAEEYLLMKNAAEKL